MAQTHAKKPAAKAKGSSPIAAFNALSDDEKERRVAEFDEPFVAETFGPLPPAQRKLWAKAKRRGPGRPRNGEGVKTIALSVEKGLLRRADQLAKKRGVTRAKLVAEALKAQLGTERAHATTRVPGAKRKKAG